MTVMFKATPVEIPAYSPSGNECELFEKAWVRQLPLLLKGPTGCGKTRFVSHMAAKVGLPLFTVSCHDDLSAADLTGRYLLKGGDTVWVDGPLTRAVRDGGVCYLDEIVKALKPSTRQRFVAIEFDFLPKVSEIAVVAQESGLEEARVVPLVELAHRLRALKGHDLEEGVSTRLLVYCACLIDSGMTVREAVRAAMIEPLTDEPDVRAALLEVADAMIR